MTKSSFCHSVGLPLLSVSPVCPWVKISFPDWFKHNLKSPMCFLLSQVVFFFVLFFVIPSFISLWIISNSQIRIYQLWICTSDFKIPKPEFHFHSAFLRICAEASVVPSSLCCCCSSRVWIHPPQGSSCLFVLNVTLSLTMKSCLRHMHLQSLLDTSTAGSIFLKTNYRLTREKSFDFATMD